jgi:hypothetical protein
MVEDNSMKQISILVYRPETRDLAISRRQASAAPAQSYAS